jgi:hypothetical protein
MHALVSRLKNCKQHLHSLKDLFRNIANREELTREFIAKFTKCHEFSLSILAGVRCCMQLKCGQESSQTSGTFSQYNQEAINDFKSRTLLIMHSELSENPEEDRDTTNQMEAFISQVDRVAAVCENVTRLIELGHIGYLEFVVCKVSSDSEANALHAETAKCVEEWGSIMKAAREEFFFLNFFYSEQIRILDSYVNCVDTCVDTCDGLRENEIMELLRFVHPDVPTRFDRSISSRRSSSVAKPLVIGAESQVTDLKARVSNIGKFLDAVFAQLSSSQAPICCGQKADAKSFVSAGNLFVASVPLCAQQRSGSSYRITEALMQLYHAKGSMPHRNQLLVCDQATTWDEVELFLGRAFRAPRHRFMCGTLFVAINVEKLSNSIQNEFIMYLKHHKFESSNAQLALLLCEMERRCLISEEYASRICSLPGLSPDAMKEIYSNVCPHVCSVTSDSVGLGKTEHLVEKSFGMGFHLRIVPINGPITRQSFVERISQVNLRPFERLHLDVSGVTDFNAVDILMFELIVLKTVVSGVRLSHLVEPEVFVELGRVCLHFITAMWWHSAFPIRRHSAFPALAESKSSLSRCVLCAPTLYTLDRPL